MDTLLKDLGTAFSDPGGMKIKASYATFEVYCGVLEEPIEEEEEESEEVKTLAQLDEQSELLGDEPKTVHISRALEAYLRDQSIDKPLDVENLNMAEAEYENKKMRSQRF